MKKPRLRSMKQSQITVESSHFLLGAVSMIFLGRQMSYYERDYGFWVEVFF